MICDENLFLRFKQLNSLKILRRNDMSVIALNEQISELSQQYGNLPIMIQFNKKEVYSIQKIDVTGEYIKIIPNKNSESTKDGTKNVLSSIFLNEIRNSLDGDRLVAIQDDKSGLDFVITGISVNIMYGRASHFILLTNRVFSVGKGVNYNNIKKRNLSMCDQLRWLHSRQFCKK